MTCRVLASLLLAASCLCKDFHPPSRLLRRDVCHAGLPTTDLPLPESSSVVMPDSKGLDTNQGGKVLVGMSRLQNGWRGRGRVGPAVPEGRGSQGEADWSGVRVSLRDPLPSQTI